MVEDLNETDFSREEMYAYKGKLYTFKGCYPNPYVHAKEFGPVAIFSPLVAEPRLHFLVLFREDTKLPGYLVSDEPLFDCSGVHQLFVVAPKSSLVAKLG